MIVDEVNDIMPGETAALKEVFGLSNLRLKRHPSIPLGHRTSLLSEIAVR